MSDDAIELGKRWVAACGARAWAVGMLVMPGSLGVPVRVFAVSPTRRCVAVVPGRDLLVGHSPADVPDVSDPPTLGAMLGVLRDWSGDPLIHTRPAAEGWWSTYGPTFLGWGEIGGTEAHALVAAAEWLAGRGGK